MRDDDEVKRENLPTTADVCIDGFDGYEDTTEGAEEQTSGRVLVGDKFLFSAEAKWVGPDGEELPRGLELMAADILRLVNYWGKDGKPVEEHTRILAPGEKFPDVSSLNDAVAKSEWREWQGTLRGPWACQHIVRFLDLATMTKYWWPSPTTTVGSARCVSELADQVKWMRRYRGQLVYAVVTLSDTFMPTRFGGRQRPDLPVKRWITFGDGGNALPATDQPLLPGGGQEVKPPSAKEATGDEVRF
jgi:hypothetical protein